MQLSPHKKPGTPCLESLPTPSLVVDQQRFLSNVARLRARFAEAPVVLRPHLKTVKSYEAACIALDSKSGPATVSTLAEAEYFGSRGITDLLYSVCITQQKLAQVTGIRRAGIDLQVLVDSEEAATFVAEHARRTKDPIPILIEVDVDGHRSGVPTGDDELLIRVGRILQDGGCDLRGVMVHAGEAYHLTDDLLLGHAADLERTGAVTMSGALRSAGFPAPVVSIGSTPTAFRLSSFDGITEVRAGVYMFFDLVQAGIGVCTIDDIALSVLATVVGHNHTKGWTIIDAGWTALSLDRGTSEQKVDQYFGVVCDLNGVPIEDLLLLRVNQEHGIVGSRPGAPSSRRRLAIGDRLRVFPNHACATSSQHDAYHVIDHSGQIVDVWKRFRGW